MFPADPVVIDSLKDPSQLFLAMGSFWQQYLSDKELLRLHQFAVLQMHADVYLHAVEVSLATAIQTITPFSARQWRLVRLLESELTDTPNVIRYGSGHAYGDGSYYGQLENRSYVWPAAVDIARIGLLVDNILVPSHVFDASNCNFVDGQLQFAVNPFDVLPTYPVYDAAGNIIDQQVLLWARNVYEDTREPYLRFGAVLKLNGTSSADYVEVLRACWAMLVKGPSIADLTRGLMASVGLRFTEGDETVQIIGVDDIGLAIITDQRVYRFNAAATPLVAVGDVLKPGQALADTVQLFEFNSGAPRDYGVLPGLAAGPELLNGVSGDIVFPNTDTTFTWVNGDVEFTVYGAASDVSAFWAGVHSRGNLAAIVGVSGPGDHKPVNPLKFVTENIIGGNLLVIAVVPEHFLGYEPGFLDRIHTLLPAGTLVLVQTNLRPISDSVDLGTSIDVASVYDAIQAPVDSGGVSGSGLVYSDYAPSITVN